LLTVLFHSSSAISLPPSYFNITPDWPHTFFNGPITQSTITEEIDFTNIIQYPSKYKMYFNSCTWSIKM